MIGDVNARNEKADTLDVLPMRLSQHLQEISVFHRGAFQKLSLVSRAVTVIVSNRVPGQALSMP